MAKTRHIQERMSQRCINTQMLEIVETFGVDNGDKVILNKKAIECALRELNRLSKKMQSLHKKGGLVLVKCGDIDITTYTLNSFNKH